MWTRNGLHGRPRSPCPRTAHFLFPGRSQPDIFGSGDRNSGRRCRRGCLGGKGGGDPSFPRGTVRARSGFRVQRGGAGAGSRKSEERGRRPAQPRPSSGGVAWIERRTDGFDPIECEDLLCSLHQALGERAERSRMATGAEAQGRGGPASAARDPIVLASIPDTRSRNVIAFSIWGDGPALPERRRHQRDRGPLPLSRLDPRFYTDRSTPQAFPRRPRPARRPDSCSSTSSGGRAWAGSGGSSPRTIPRWTSIWCAMPMR